MQQQEQIMIGWAQTSITPNRPTYLAGQFYERISSFVHDPITATALAISKGDEQIIFLSLDMCATPDSAIAEAKKRLSTIPGLNVDMISANVTHTHNSLCPGKDTLTQLYCDVFGEERVARLPLPDHFMDIPEVSDFLAERIHDVIQSAWNDRKPGGISAATDYAAIAFNRRPVYADGKTIMYGACSREDFMGLEGVADHTADMLYTWSPCGHLTGVMVNIPCPSQVMELHRFISSDYWHYAKDAIREELGQIFVLPLCGAAGDQNPLDLIRLSKTNEAELAQWGAQEGEVIRNIDLEGECRDIGARIADAVRRGYKKARNSVDYNATIHHEIHTVTLPIRLVTKEEYDEANAIIQTVKAKHTAQNPMTTAEMVPLYPPVGVVCRWAQQQESTTYDMSMHLMQMGTVALATNTFELFSEFGMRIKGRSPAAHTMLAQLANGSGGYLPTQAAVSGGSYSSTAASTLCGPQGGDKLVETTLELLHAMWQMP